MTSHAASRRRGLSRNRKPASSSKTAARPLWGLSGLFRLDAGLVDHLAPAPGLLFTKALACAGVPPPGPMLSAAKRCSRPGSCIAALAAALSLVIISGGVFGGAVIACQVSEMQP